MLGRDGMLGDGRVEGRLTEGREVDGRLFERLRLIEGLRPTEGRAPPPRMPPREPPREPPPPRPPRAKASDATSDKMTIATHMKYPVRIMVFSNANGRLKTT
ncbi:MAG: hypothetical protein ACC628_09695 [Pirellulaceae bacterium]